MNTRLRELLSGLLAVEKAELARNMLRALIGIEARGDSCQAWMIDHLIAGVVGQSASVPHQTGISRADRLL
jgi:hypothetical protein